MNLAALPPFGLEEEMVSSDALGLLLGGFRVFAPCMPPPPQGMP